MSMTAQGFIVPVVAVVFVMLNQVELKRETGPETRNVGFHRKVHHDTLEVTPFILKLQKVG